MTLGERISALRTARDMSQGSLAEELGVSRQSVSKWETNSSVPELDKLVQLADIFGVTLDYLAGREAEAAPEAPPQVLVIKKPETRIIIGSIILGAGVIITLLLLVLASTVPLLGLHLILCGALCLLIKRHAGLIIGWLTMALLIPFTRYFMAVRMSFIFYPSFYQYASTVVILLSWAMWAYLVALTVCTVLAVKRARK